MRVYVGRIIAVILSIIGVCLLLYPTAASWTHQYHQSTIIKTLHTDVASAHPSANEQIQAAHKYNKALTSGARLAPNTNVPLSDVRETEASLGLWEYDKILSLGDTGIMGRIVIPKAEVDLPIYHGTSEASLLRGAGHLQGTSLPVGGINTRTVITAHRGLADATMFTHLDRLEKGDVFTVNIFDEVLTYRIFDTKVVAPEESEAIIAVPGKDLATLVTCTPLGINSHRILVTGERIIPTPVSEQKLATEESQLPTFPWFAVGFLVFLLAALAVFVHSIICIRRIRREATVAAAVAQVTGSAELPSSEALSAGFDYQPRHAAPQ